MRIFTTLAAIVGVFALGLQSAITIGEFLAEGKTVLDALWRLVRQFTIWSNVTVTVVMAAAAIAPKSWFTDMRVWLFAVPPLVITGTVYYTLLKFRYEPAPFHVHLAQDMLHAAMPTLSALAFLSAKHGALKFKHFGWGALQGGIYGVYILIRGAFEGSYPYWFVNAPALGWWGSIKSAVMLMSAFSVVALIFIAMDKALARFGSGFAGRAQPR
ncbi:MAG: Pr6Pr family membrane protein [Pseudomonadota bacterium]